MIYCPHCTKPSSRKSGACPHCGGDLQGAKTPPKAPAKRQAPKATPKAPAKQQAPKKPEFAPTERHEPLTPTQTDAEQAKAPGKIKSSGLELDVTDEPSKFHPSSDVGYPSPIGGDQTRVKAVSNEQYEAGGQTGLERESSARPSKAKRIGSLIEKGVGVGKLAARESSRLSLSVAKNIDVKKHWKIGVGIMAAVLAIVLFMTLFDFSKENGENGPNDAENGGRTGCKSDDDCGPRSICAASGCLILISSESRNIWHEEISAQINPKPDAGAPWEPHDSFGEKLIPTSLCPAVSGKVDTPEEKRIETLAKVTVYELGLSKMRIHKQRRVKGLVWVDALRFWFKELDNRKPAVICSSKEIANISIGKAVLFGKKVTHIDVSLNKAAPAGSATTGALSVSLRVPPAGPDGNQKLSFALDPVFGTGRYHTVVAVPLGANIIGIEGPPPTMQRLLTGFVAYYWEHSTSASRGAVQYRFPSEIKQKLNLAEVNP